MSTSTPRILVVGAGAVGQVYGQALQAGGATVVFYAREKYRASLEDEEGLPLRVMNRPRGQQLQRWRPDGVVCTADEVAAQHFDVVWLCVSSPALRLPWFDALARAVGEAVVVSLQPGLIDTAFMDARVSPERLVMGMIPYIAWSSPLPDQHPLEGDPALTVWHPPLSATPLSGPPALVEGVVASLRAGGLSARVVDDATVTGSFGSALLLSLIAGLEAADWRFATLRTRPHATRALASAHEALAIAAAVHGEKVPWFMRAVGPAVLSGVTRLAPWVVPFPLEPYLAYHFTKVGEQTRQSLARWREEGTRLGFSVTAIAALEQALAERDGVG